VFPLGYHLPRDEAPSKEVAVEFAKSKKVDPSGIVCLFAGTLGRTYDLSPVIAAARNLADLPEPKFQFVVCGDGERCNEWKEKAADLQNVIFTGWLDQVQIKKMLAVAHVGLAAYVEGAPQSMPNKVIEYLAAGLPVLSSLPGETRNVLQEQDCGLTYAPEEAGSFTVELMKLRDTALRRRLSLNARRLFERHFEAERVYGQFADYLEEVADFSPQFGLGRLAAV
jgi:glycosyltransferase involved in cell wall biosynthesis